LIARADTLAGHNTSNGLSAGGYYAQGFTVSGAGAFDDITFSFISPSGPYAVGTGYLFSTPFTGTPSDLSSSSYLGSAASSGNVYTFSPSLELTSGQTYYFYEDGLVGQNDLGVDASTGDSYYWSADSTSAYINAPFTDMFIVTGDPVSAAAPEPSSLALLGTGILGFAGLIRRRLS
jgi:hypothetical protein